MDIRMYVVERVEAELFGTVPDDIWEKYQNGEIPDFYLFSHYFKENRSETVGPPMVTDIEEVEEEDND